MNPTRPLSVEQLVWAHGIFRRYAAVSYWSLAGTYEEYVGWDVGVFAFLNGWQCRITRDTATRRRIIARIHRVWDAISPETYHCDLFTFRDLPKRVFEELSDIAWTHANGRHRTLGPTATAKILHLLRPDVFVMWDAAIRDYYGVEGNAEGYSDFQEMMTSLAVSLFEAIQIEPRSGVERPEGAICRALACEHPQPITMTKLLDEYNWLAITNEVHFSTR